MEVKIETITAADVDPVLEFLKLTFFKVSANNVTSGRGYSIKSVSFLLHRKNP